MHVSPGSGPAAAGRLRSSARGPSARTAQHPGPWAPARLGASSSPGRSALGPAPLGLAHSVRDAWGFLGDSWVRPFTSLSTPAPWKETMFPPAFWRLLRLGERATSNSHLGVESRQSWHPVRWGSVSLSRGLQHECRAGVSALERLLGLRSLVGVACAAVTWLWEWASRGRVSGARFRPCLCAHGLLGARNSTRSLELS